jgi:hypothetical protein
MNDDNTEPAKTEATEPPITSCPECGAALQAIVKVYLYDVAVTPNGVVLSYEGGPQPEDESDILELCDLQNTTVYCANDHPFDPAKSDGPADDSNGTCPYCAFDGVSVTTHNPDAHAEAGDPHYHENNRCCFCGAEDQHECLDCPDLSARSKLK